MFINIIIINVSCIFQKGVILGDNSLETQTSYSNDFQSTQPVVEAGAPPSCATETHPLQTRTVNMSPQNYLSEQCIINLNTNNQFVDCKKSLQISTLKVSYVLFNIPIPNAFGSTSLF